MAKSLLDLEFVKPQNLNEFVGQVKAKRISEVIIKAASIEQRDLPNLLITGPYGQGKTSLARLITTEFGKPRNLLDADVVNKIIPVNQKVIIDEIHNLKPATCDTLNILLDQNRILIIGCTTSPGQLPPAFKSRFRVIELGPYTSQDIFKILKQALNKRGLVDVQSAVITEVVKRSRLNPRIALNYLRFILDLTTTKLLRRPLLPVVKEAFLLLEVDKRGLTSRDMLYLETIPKHRPVGIKYIASKISIDEVTIEQEIEPYLMQLGLIDRTPQGRIRLV